jgi:hypothetical protein
MSLPFSLPDWMPGWLALALAVPALLWLLAFLMMPFNVFGVKARLEALESELESLHEELRIMQMRAAGVISTPVRSLDPYDDVPHFGQLKRGRTPSDPEETQPQARPPIPTPDPRSFTARDYPAARERQAPLPQPRPRRTEPRLD